jgi:hypothetical protein
MDTLNQKIQTNRPDISTKSVELYAKKIIKLAKDAQISLDDIPNNYDTVSSFLNASDLKLASKRAYVEAILTLLPNDSSELVNKYRDLRYQYYNQLYTQSKEVITSNDNIGEVVGIINQYYKELKTAEITKDTANKFMDFIILLITFINPFHLAFNDENLGYIFFKRTKKDGKNFNLNKYSAVLDIPERELRIYLRDKPELKEFEIADNSDESIAKYMGNKTADIYFLSDEFVKLMKQWGKINMTPYLLYKVSTNDAFGGNFRNYFNTLKKKYPVLDTVKLSKNRGRILESQLDFKLFLN